MLLTSKEIDILTKNRGNFSKSHVRQIKAIYEKYSGNKLPCPTCSFVNRKIIHTTVYEWYDEITT